ncbi:MoxR family ATPase [Bradyrhizobium sp. CCGUVB1N3]|uniref:AAA family ATPase n=1 Tax=Bradyrhizobium sp. CCGUVB1N3 TaxID=2949629 RepID=UPI0020B21B84|nr:MoxR family ATPase [Bradyrhizobium sp. CCGUVB1N3]MCP3477374.1 MoxR family ATPase [Bradyrhizobium sp. CCGUVB1N3]
MAALDSTISNTLNKEPLFYRGGTQGPRRSLSELPLPARILGGQPDAYRASPSLIRAVNVAMSLRMPLLLAGEPGVGKTELATAICADLGLPVGTSLIRMTVTSDASKETILYRFDELGRLRDAYRDADDANPKPVRPMTRRTGDARSKEPISAYIAFVGLGRAILEAGGPNAPLQKLEAVGRGSRFRGELNVFQDLVADDLPIRQSPPIVLIDEIDKAPRDLPNDLLTELDLMQFDIPQLGVRVRLDNPRSWPIVIMTTNSERSLPEAFLRRCIFHHIDFPPQESRFPGDVTIGEIVRARLADISVSEALFDDALSFVHELRIQRGLGKRPATAEVLAWMRQLLDPERSGRTSVSSLRNLPSEQLEASLGVLLKSTPDLELGRNVLQSWLKQKT